MAQIDASVVTIGNRSGVIIIEFDGRGVRLSEERREDPTIMMIDAVVGHH
jgi:hypothetical protein